MGRKTSIVWNHFTIPVLYPKKALCNYCRQLVCRGQTNLGTTSLMNHLKRCNEFKIAVLGLPKGINEMMADIITGPDSQNSRIDVEDTSEAEASDNTERESAWQSAGTGTPEQRPLPLMHGMDDPPSFVGRRPLFSTNMSPQDFQNKDRSSMLLYGDISSTSEPVEEPSSSNMCDNSFLTSAATDLMNYTSSNSTVNFVYGGLVLHMFYQQYKMGKFCDLHIIPQRLSSNEATISETGKVIRKNFSSENEDVKISVHASLLSSMSRKINSLVDVGCSTIQLKKGDSESVRGLMEITYTGKLEKIRTYSDRHLTEILEVARFLEVDYAVQYLMREIPEKKTKPKIIAPKVLFREKMLAKPHILQGLAGCSPKNDQPTVVSSYNVLKKSHTPVLLQNRTVVKMEKGVSTALSLVQPILKSPHSESEALTSPLRNASKSLSTTQYGINHQHEISELFHRSKYDVVATPDEPTESKRQKLSDEAEATPDWVTQEKLVGTKISEGTGSTPDWVTRERQKLTVNWVTKERGVFVEEKQLSDGAATGPDWETQGNDIDVEGMNHVSRGSPEY